MPRTKRWPWTDLGRGFVEVRLSSWMQFPDFVHQDMLSYETYVWRGHRCDDWKLVPTLDRLIGNVRMSKERRGKFLTSHLEQFQYAARGRRGQNPPNLRDENDWWALGQHHGLATPLLDWTTSPFVAAFFAFIDVGEKQTQHRAVFALHRPTVELRSHQLAREEDAKRRERKAEIDSGKAKGNILERISLDQKADPDVQFIRPLTDENQRLVNQGGLFTRSPSGKSLEDWIQQTHREEDNGYSLIKILIPNRDRENALRILNRMNINHLSLFPDLAGASNFCNLFSGIECY